MARSLSASRRPGPTLYRYIARESRRPFLFALIGLTLAVLTQDLIGFSELVINRGLGAGEVGLIAFYEAVPLASTMFPFAVLIGALVALGRLGADYEILVLEASGIAAPRLVWPVVSFASTMTILSVLLSLWGAPYTQRALDGALDRISQQQPWANFRAGVVAQFGGWQVEAREVSASGDELKGVLLYVPDIGETVFAREGKVSTGSDGGVALELSHGSLVLATRDGAQQLRFETLTTELPASEDLEVGDLTELSGATLRELVDRVLAFEPTEEVFVSRADIELQRRFATPAATVIFGFLAVPLFLMRRNFSRANGAMLGVAATIVHFVLMQFGEGLIQAGTLDEGQGVWLPNGALAVIAVLLLLRYRREGVLGHAFDRPQLSDRGLRFFRSRDTGRPRRAALQRYISARFLELAAVAFLVLLSAYLLIDVMERLDWFARYRATGFEILRFYVARVPLLASRVVPMALLIGTALVVSLLAVEGELIGMRACGIPAPRALLPVFLLMLAVAPGYFLLRNVVVPRTNAVADELKQTEIKQEFYAQLAERRRSHVWRRSGDRVVEAERFDTDRGYARDLTVYEIGSNGLPASRTDARFARHIGRGDWRLSGPRRIEIVGDHAHVVASPPYVQLGETLVAEVDTMHLSVGQLAEEIETVEADGYDATQLRVDYHVKLADALACIVMPVSVLFFAVGGPPFPGPAQTLLVSGMIAVGWILLTGVGASLGYGGTLPPVVGGWGPTLLFSALASFLALRLYNRRL
jgi:LPS export ABC transporter permease LptG